MLFHAVSTVYIWGCNTIDWQNWINKSRIITFEHLLGYAPCPLTCSEAGKKKNLNKFEPKPLKFLLPPVPTVCLCVHFLVEVYVSSVSVPPHSSPLNRSTCFPPPLSNLSSYQNGSDSSFLGRAVDRAAVLCQSALLSSVSAVMWKPENLRRLLASCSQETTNSYQANLLHQN